jgi:two-component system, LuxR family, response regulator FixJ
MNNAEPTVFVVDDDDGVRRGLSLLLSSVGLRVETFPGAQEFLQAFDPERTGCLVLDVRMPGMSGLELQERLKADHSDIPIIILTGHGDVQMAVRAVQAGAVDFIEKPFREQMLLDRIQQAMAQDAENRAQHARLAVSRDRLARLTQREREVLRLVVAGRHNKTIAEELGVTVKTIEFHRSKIMEKTKAVSVAELVRLVLETRADL